MKNHLLLTCLLIASQLFSQTAKFSENFKVTKADLQLNSYKKDSTANALIIYETGKSWVANKDYKLNTKIKRKLKIFNKDGLSEGTIMIYLYDNGKGRKETVSDIKATVYNLDNGKTSTTKLDDSGIFEEQYNEKYSIVKFTFPNIKEGSIINYTYTVKSPFMFKYYGWDFQGDIPKIYSEYNASIPGNWEYNTKLVGGKKLVKNNSKIKKNCLEGPRGSSAHCAEYQFAMRDIPAFIEEDYMTTKNNYLARIEYELKTFRGFDGVVDNITKTWETTDDEIKRDTDLGRQLRKTNLAKGLFDESINGETDELKKAKAIFSSVQEQYTWNGKYRVFEDVSLRNLIKERSGNIGEINSLLHNALVAQNIEAYPILVSTRNNGLVTKLYPVISDFNYLIVLARIDGKDYFLDASDNFLSFGQVSFRSLNQYGRLIDFNNESRWIDIKSPVVSSKKYLFQISLNDENQLSGKVKIRNSGYHALKSRKEYFTDKESFLDNFEEANDNLEIESHEVSTLKETESDFNATLDFKTSLNSIGNTIYLNPYLLKFFTKNPFQLQRRSYPVDFGYKDVFSYSAVIHVDDIYAIKEIPEPRTLSLPNRAATFTSQYSKTGQTIQIHFKLSFNQVIYDPEYYFGLKKIMSSVVDAQMNDLIVLEMVK